MKLTMSQYNWQLPEQDAQFAKNYQQLTEAGLNFSPAFLRILAHRGFSSESQVNQATNQTPQIFHDPFLMKDMDIAVKRLHQAIAEGQRILIYGDYDADGITSTLILYESLEQLGADVHYYLPNRIEDGYGPNIDKYKDYIEAGIDLILTCDNGVAGFEAIEYAMNLDVDVIVTDHHEIQEKLPRAYAIVHPDHPQGEYPFKHLSGAGVALKLATALMDEVPVEAIELAMIGTIADMVDLSDENRTIVLSGLNLIKNTQRIGLKTLLDKQDISSETINEETIGFVIGPRLNAIGRLGDPSPGLELLKTFDDIQANQLVEEIEEINNQRKTMVDSIYQEVVSMINPKNIPDIIIEAGEDWNAGVLGIVASRLCRDYHRPVILCQYLKDTNVYKGSSRSIDGINIFDCIEKQAEILKAFGGHEQAAGLTVEHCHWQTFKDVMLKELTQYRQLIDQSPNLKVDVSLSLEELTMDFIEEIKLLGPFGTGNPKIRVHFSDMWVKNIKYLGKNKDHVKIMLQEDVQELSCMAFNKGTAYQDLQEETRLSVVGHMNVNRWKNQINLQCIIEDIGVEGSVWVDFRGSHIHPQVFELTDALYVFKDKAWMESMRPKLPINSVACLYEMPNVNDAFEKLVIMQPPLNLIDLENLLQEQSFQTIYVGSYVNESKYMQGLPQDNEIKYFYTWLMGQPAFEIKPNLLKISQHLKISVLKLKMMILMFSEAKFVTIKSGWIRMNPKETHNKVDLMQLPSVKAYQAAMQVEAKLNFEPIAQVKAYFEREER